MNKLWLILSLCCFALCASAREYADTAVYQGMSLKLDLATPILELARSKGKIQDYELAINVRLAQRFYPTLELGYAKAKRKPIVYLQKAEADTNDLIFSLSNFHILYTSPKDLFDQLSEQLKPNVKNDLIRFREDIQEMLELEIVKRYYYQKGVIEYGLRNDNWLKTAIEIIKR